MTPKSFFIRAVLPIIVVLTIAVLVFDVFTPAGVAAWLFYLIPLLLSRWETQRINPLLLAMAFTVLTVVAYFLSPQGVSGSIAVLNRSMGVAVFWLTALLLVRSMQVEEALRESEQKYRELSIVDGLTQLYNSRHFYVQLKSETERSNRYGQPLTLLLLDLDDFKAFNDAYGHVEGDQVLSRLGRVLKRCLRETDSAYRYGGEEFTILLPMTTSGDGVITAERIRTEFKKEAFSPAAGRDVHMAVSIGFAQYNPQEDMKAFVHRVDQLMYQAKKNGKDRVCCES